MNLIHAVIQWIDNQPWLEKISKSLQKLVVSIFSSGGPTALKIRDFLHGTWLGHPVHPALTDVPIGAFTAALTLDSLEMTTGKSSYGKGADTAIKVGLVGGAASAVTGFVDWHHTEHTPRRIGTAHALLNTTAMALYLSSLGARSRGNRKAGFALGALGFTISTAAAYLGGHLVYAHKIGVDRSPEAGLPNDYVPVLLERELMENQLYRAEVNNLPVLLVRKGGRVYALAETCAHMAGPLSEGILTEDNAVECPWHGSRFSLEDGRVLRGPSTYSQPCFNVRVRDGMIEIRLEKVTTT
jgi:nitrite reductase/ring-hydroxylating ferredoxin subunit/uncharacterized membrane protein